MNIDTTSIGNYTIIQIHGRIDTITAHDFETKMLAVMEHETHLILDCGDLHYISSSGLRVFLIALKKINAAGGSLKLCSLQPSIKEIFDISGFSTIFSIHPDIESATSS